MKFEAKGQSWKWYTWAQTQDDPIRKNKKDELDPAQSPTGTTDLYVPYLPHPDSELDEFGMQISNLRKISTIFHCHLSHLSPIQSGPTATKAQGVLDQAQKSPAVTDVVSFILCNDEECCKRKGAMEECISA